LLFPSPFLPKVRAYGGDLQFRTLFPAFVLRIQIPLAQALKHRLFLLFQHQRQ
jgi:hypothetical protein